MTEDEVDAEGERPRQGWSEISDRPDRADLSRRRLLAAAASAASVAGLAGCNDQSLGNQEFESKPVHLTEEGMAGGGYRSADHQPIERSRSRSVGGQDVTVSITSHVTSYAVEAAAEDPPPGAAASRLPLGLLTTPSAKVLGEQLNPLLAASGEQLLTGERGRALLAAATPLDGDFEWVVGPEQTGDGQEATLFGEAVPLRAYTGVVDGSSGREAVVVYLARGTRKSDAVISTAVKRVPVDAEFDGPVVVAREDVGGTDRDEAEGTPTPEEGGGGSGGRGTSFAFYEFEVIGKQYEFLGNLHEHIDVGPPIETPPPPPPDLVPKDLRLVQAVEDTKVTTSPPTQASQHDMVVGDKTAAVFDPSVGGSGSMSSRLGRLPAWYNVEIKVVGKSGSTVHTTLLAKSDLKTFVNSGDDHRKVWTQLARDTISAATPKIDDLSVFELPQDVQRVTVTMKTPSGNSLGSRTVTAGQDFEVALTGPLKVGFIQVEDPGSGSNYGSKGGGLPQAFYGHVDNCVDYLKSAFPGPVAAYRTGRWWVGGKQRKVTKNSGFLGLGSKTVDGIVIDHKNAKKRLENLKSKSRFFKDGKVYAQGMSKATAKQKIRNDGFDCVVLVTPGTDPSNNAAVASASSPYGSYYDYHQNDKASDPGNTRTLGKMFYDHRLAVGGLDYKDPWLDGVYAASVTAQELTHFFVDKPYKGVGGSNQPFAQRGSGGSDTRVSGNPVDLDHARQLTTGVTSVGYDLADGTFRAINDPSMKNTSPPFGSGELRQTDFGSSSLSTYESFMSYSGADKWADAVVYQDLLHYQYEWRCDYGDVTCISRISAEGTEASDAGHQGPEREEGEMLTAVGVVDDEGTVTVVDYELMDTVREPPEEGDEIEVDLLDGLEGASLAAETHPGTIGSNHATSHPPEEEGNEYDAVVIELPFEAGATHLRTAGPGGPRVDNAIRGVVGAGLARLEEGVMDEATRGELRERLEDLEALVDERRFGEARDLLGEIRSVVAEEVEQREPVEDVEGVGEVRDIAATTRDDVLEQIDRLRDHLEGMA